MNRHALGGLIALSLLSGCGSSDKEVSAAKVDDTAVSVATAESTTVISTADSEAVTESSGGRVKVTDAKDLPDYAPAYPGAEVKTRVASADSEEGSGSLIAMRTEDSFEQVVAFYDLKAKRANTPAKMVTNEKDASVRVFGNETTGEGSLVAISRDASGTGTVIVITSGKGKLVPKDKDEAAKVAASQGVRLQ